MMIRLVLSLALLAAGCAAVGAGADASAFDYAPRRMADGKLWTTRNLAVVTSGSYCYGGAQANCRRYGRLYSWQAAQTVCASLGDGWRLPTNDDWRALASAYGGLYEESIERGRAAYAALVEGGPSGFEVLAGGGLTPEGEYARGGDHGFFWTATETDPDHAWLYNFGRNAGFINRHRDSEKSRAVSVRCLHD